MDKTVASGVTDVGSIPTMGTRLIPNLNVYFYKVRVLIYNKAFIYNKKGAVVMACATIHLAIAKKYLESHKELNYEKVIAGTLYPDAEKNNDKSHYTNMNRNDDNISHVRNKVNLYSFLKEHENLDNFELGWFLHLITDYLFFKECFTEEYLLNNSYEDFCKDLYFAYEHLNLYLSEKYNIIEKDYKDYPSEYYPGKPYEDCILPKKMIDNFINRVSTIDLDKYIKKIKKYQGNITP